MQQQLMINGLFAVAAICTVCLVVILLRLAGAVLRGRVVPSRRAVTAVLVLGAVALAAFVGLGSQSASYIASL